ncbi:hypothetical protein LguiA_002241 [Lonicera macranthoides]
MTKTSKVSQASDVYSYGVFLLELLTRKFPVHSIGGDEAYHLVQWVNSVIRGEWISSVFDIELVRYPKIEEEMTKLLQIGMVCAKRVAKKRPKMTDVPPSSHMSVRLVIQVVRIETKAIIGCFDFSLSETWTRASEPSGSVALGLDNRGEKLRHYTRDMIRIDVLWMMSSSSDVNITPPSTMSVGVGIDSVFGMVEKVDRAIQTDEFEIVSFDLYIPREERRSLAHAFFSCGSSEHVMEYCPLRIHCSKRVGSGEESSIKRRRREPIVGTTKVSPPVSIPIESTPMGPKIGCFICHSPDHFRKNCPRRGESRPSGVVQRKHSGASGSGTRRS